MNDSHFTPAKQLSAEGPTTEQIELIGLELAVTDTQGRETELEMHGIKRTIPNEHWMRQFARVTVHTSNGDITVRFPLRVGQYNAF